MEIINGQTCYSIDEVREMLDKHLEEESERRDWYLSFSDGSVEREILRKRDEALHEYFRVQGMTSIKVLLYESELIDCELDEKEKKELLRYKDVKETYETRNCKYINFHEKKVALNLAMSEN